MRTLAVTGGIGSGKSYVVRMFAALGVPVYDADSRTKRLYDEDRGLLGTLQELDRQYMAGRIFSDRCLLEKVEALVFPEVIADFRTWKKRVADAPFAIMESAIYLEKPALAGVADKVLTVLCPEDVRIGRVMARSGMSREQVLARMANQWSDERRTAASDYVIVSDFRHPLLPQVESVYIDMKDNS